MATTHVESPSELQNALMYLADVYVLRAGMGQRVPFISTRVIQQDITAALGQHVFLYLLDMNVTVLLEKQENTVKEV
jgi:hypothetical protein